MYLKCVQAPRATLVLLTAAALGLSACGGSSGDSGSSGGYGASAAKPAAASGYGDPGDTATPTTLEVHRGPLGTFIVDGEGRPLYLWEKDDSSKSACSGACADAWPPATTTGKPQVGAGLEAGLAGTTERADGSLQLTYGGHPLYRFAGDQQSGEPTGQGNAGFGAPWYVVRPSGDKLDED